MRKLLKYCDFNLIEAHPSQRLLQSSIFKRVLQDPTSMVVTNVDTGYLTIIKRETVKVYPDLWFKLPKGNYVRLADSLTTTIVSALNLLEAAGIYRVTLGMASGGFLDLHTVHYNLYDINTFVVKSMRLLEESPVDTSFNPPRS